MRRGSCPSGLHGYPARTASVAMDWERFQKELALQESGQYDKALVELCSLAELAASPEEMIVVLQGKIDCLLGLARIQEAKQCLAEIERLLPQLQEGYSDFLPRAKLFEARILYFEAKPKKALNVLNKTLAKHSRLLHLPDNRDVRDVYEEIQRDRGILLAELNRLSEAKPLLEEALTYEVNHGDVDYHLGVCYFELGELIRAKEQFLAVLNRDAHQSLTGRAHYHLGIIYYKEAAYARAKQEFEVAEIVAEEAHVSKKYIYGWLAKTCRALGLEADADRYTKLRAAQKN